MKNVIITGVILLFFANTLFSQMGNSLFNKVNNEQLNLIESTLMIKGTSTLHDWISIAEKSKAFIVLNDKETQIEKLNLVVAVASIKNNKGSSMMDKLTREALKESKFPKITYEFINATIIDNQNDILKLKLKGDLTIAGKTKQVLIVALINKMGSNVTLKGSHKLLMTDFGIDPPTALFGTIKTGDEITIEFSIKF